MVCTDDLLCSLEMRNCTSYPDGQLVEVGVHVPRRRQEHVNICYCELCDRDTGEGSEDSQDGQDQPLPSSSDTLHASPDVAMSKLRRIATAAGIDWSISDSRMRLAGEIKGAHEGGCDCEVCDAVDRM